MLNLDLPLIEKTNNNDVDYLSATFSLWEIKWEVKVNYPIQNEDGNGYASPGFLKIYSRFESDNTDLPSVCEDFTIPLYEKLDRHGDEYMLGFFNFLNVKFKALVWYPEREDDSEEPIGPGRIKIQTANANGS